MTDVDPRPANEIRRLARLVVRRFCGQYGRPPDLADALDRARLVVMTKHADDIERRAKRLYERVLGVVGATADGRRIEFIEGSLPRPGEAPEVIPVSAVEAAKGDILVEAVAEVVAGGGRRN